MKKKRYLRFNIKLKKTSDMYDVKGVAKITLVNYSKWLKL